MTMTKPSTQVAQPFKLTLESAFFDWRSMRVQFALGFAIIMICFALVTQEFLATRFLPQEYVAVGRLLPHVSSALDFTKAEWSTNPLLLLEVMVFTHHAWWYRAMTFAVMALTALTTGLITLDISIRYGNRIGAAPAVFAALLFAIMPLHSSLVLPGDLLSIGLSNLLALYSIFLDMRFRLLKETRYYWIALLSLILAGILDPRGAVVAVLGIVLCRLFITESGKRIRAGILDSYIGLILFFLATLIFVCTHLAVVSDGIVKDVPGSVHTFLTPLFTGKTIGLENFGRVLQAALPILIATIFSITTVRLIIGSMWLRPLFFAGSWLASLLISIQVLKLTGAADASTALSAIFLAPPLCILLSLSALPAIDVLTKRSRIFFTALGALALSGVIFCWGLLLLVQIHDSFARARELTLFKIQLSHRMQSTEGKLVVINPPFDTTEEIEQISIAGEIKAELPENRDREERIFSGLLDSPLANQVIPIAARRRQPIGFVRLSKKEHATPDPKVPATAVTDYYAWSKELGRLMPIYYVGAANVKITVNPDSLKRVKTEPREISKIPSNQWEQLPIAQGYIEKLTEGAGLHAGEKEDLLVWFPHELLDPTKSNLVRVHCSRRNGGRKSPVYLIFKGKDSDDVGVIQLRLSTPDQNGDTVFEATTRGFAEWNRHSAISSLGIKLPAGSEGIVLKSIETMRGANNQ